MLTPTDQETKTDRVLTQRSARESAVPASPMESDSVARFMRKPLHRIGVVLWDAIYWGLLRNESFAHASNIAFSILMSLFPFMILVTGLAGVWGGSELAQAAEQGTGGIFSVLPDEIGKILRPEVAAVLTGSQARVVTVGSILLVIIVTGLVEALRMGLNYAYRAYDSRHFLIRRLEGTFFMLIGGVVVLGLGFLVVVLPVVWDFVLPHAPELQGYYDYFNRLPLLFFTLGVLLFLLAAHVWLPARKQTVMGVLPGVTVTMCLWFAAGWIFSWYLSHFSGYARTYAGLGGVIASLIFFYIVGFIFLFGAELNNSLLKGPNIKAGSDWRGHQ